MISTDGQTFAQRAQRGRKTKFVARVLRAFNVNGDLVSSYAAIAEWEFDQHILFWTLLGYDGRFWIDSNSGVPGMIGETKRLWAEVTR